MDNQSTTQATSTKPTETQVSEPNNPSGASTKTTQAQGQTAVQAAAAEAKRKLKIDDQEVDEDEVIKTYKERTGHQRAANKILQEGKAAKKQAEQFVSMMRDKNALIPTLEKLGYKKEDLRKLSEEYLATVLTEEMMDPKEKEIKELRAKVAAGEEKDRLTKKQVEDAEFESLKKAESERFSKEFIEAIKTTNLPPTKEMVGAIAGYIARATKIKMTMSPLEAAKLVQEDEDKRIQHRLKNATPEQLMKILKEEDLAKIRGYDVAKLKDPNSHLKTPAEQGEPNRDRTKSDHRMTPEQWRRHKMGL